jgi:hypothetical protein
MLRVSLLFAFLAPATVFALATEQLGNKPITGGLNFDAQLLTAVNVDSRVYWYEVNGNPHFFFKGGPKELNEAIRRFALIKHEKREIILLPGPGKRTTLDGKTEVAYNWELHVPMGFNFGKESEVSDVRATLIIHIDALLPSAPADPKQVKQWIRELNSDEFKVRARAAGDLEALGPSVAPLLREAMKENLSAEAYDRVGRVLGNVSKEVRLDVLELPKDIPIVSVETLLGRARKELSNKDGEVRGYAVSSLSRHEVSPQEILPDLEKMLKSETHEYAIRCTAGVASRLGVEGKPLLPTLRELLKSKDKNVQASAQYAIDAIEKAKGEALPEANVKRKATIRKEIKEFVTANNGK